MAAHTFKHQKVTNRCNATAASLTFTWVVFNLHFWLSLLEATVGPVLAARTRMMTMKRMLDLPFQTPRL